MAHRDQPAWVDWSDIRPTTRWWREILSGIESSDNFAFVISPDSAASRVCHKEMAHAAKNGKRLIPILLAEVASSRLPPALAETQWISFASGQDFAAAVNRLLEAIRLDPEWVEAHTRLLVRAREWERRKRDSSFLLRGMDLQDAGQWLARASPPEPPRPAPAGIQTEYIQASREWEASEIARLRDLVEEKEQQRRLAVARQLAAQSELTRAQAPGMLDLSVLLALESTDRAELFETTWALQQTVPLLPRVVMRAAYQGAVLRVVFHPGGALLATVENGGSVRLLEIAGGRELWKVKARPPVRFSSDGEFLLAGVDDALSLFRTATGEVVRDICRMFLLDSRAACGAQGIWPRKLAPG